MHGSNQEFTGILRILSENHILFDIVEDSVLDHPDTLAKLSGYQAIILPDTQNLTMNNCQLIDDYVAKGGKLLATGATSRCDMNGSPRKHLGLHCLGTQTIQESLPQQQGTYFAIRPQDKESLSGFENLDIIYLYGEYQLCSLKQGAKGYFGYIPPCMFGPPEKCYYTEVTNHPGVIQYKHNLGDSLLIPWGIGRHYQRLSHHAHAKLLIAALKGLLGVSPSLHSNASPLVEIASYRKKAEDIQLVHAINLSGQLGTAFHAPQPMYDIQITTVVDQLVTSVYALRSGKEVPFKQISASEIEFQLPRLDLFETMVVR